MTGLLFNAFLTIFLSSSISTGIEPPPVFVNGKLYTLDMARARGIDELYPSQIILEEKVTALIERVCLLEFRVGKSLDDINSNIEYAVSRRFDANLVISNDGSDSEGQREKSFKLQYERRRLEKLVIWELLDASIEPPGEDILQQWERSKRIIDKKVDWYNDLQISFAGPVNLDTVKSSLATFLGISHFLAPFLAPAAIPTITPIPTCCITGPSKIPIEKQALFTACSTNPSSKRDVWYFWEFGSKDFQDWSQNPKAHYTFTKPGKNEVVLYVVTKDERLCEPGRLTVTVVEPTPSPKP